MNFIYEIATMDTTTSAEMSDVVTNIHYRIYPNIESPAVGTVIPVEAGMVQLDAPSSESFIDFSNLTKEQAVEWLKSKINYSEIEDCLEAEYNEADLVVIQDSSVTQSSKLPESWSN